jgi:hypothetical protein
MAHGVMSTFLHNFLLELPITDVTSTHKIKAMKKAAYSTVITRPSYNIVYYLITSISKQSQINLANKPPASSITA